MPGQNLCLLALDGGGVRGLSSLQIVKQLMETINPDRPPKPCEYFDMIGGTSTGGLIAIMLGRLHMDVDECIEAYIRLADRVLRRQGLPSIFAAEFKAGLTQRPWNKKLKESFAGTQVQKTVSYIMKIQRHVKSLYVPREWKMQALCSLEATHLGAPRIWEVARATSAPPSFFDPIQIGRFGEGFSDGGTGANNPVQMVWKEAQDTFLPRGQLLEGNLKCLVSIGTGKPSLEAFGNKLQTVAHTLIRMATDTENTAIQFSNTHQTLRSSGQYYRFNVDRGLEHIGLEDASKANTIMAATRNYLESAELKEQMRRCGRKLKAGRRRRGAQRVRMPRVHA